MHKLSTKNTRVNKKYKKLTRNLPRGPSKQKKKRTRKRKQMKGGDVSPIENIFYIWLGETEKCGLTQKNLKSWRDGFPEARITILVIEEKITEFNKRFELILKEFGVIVVSPIDFLGTLPPNEPIQKTIGLLEKFLPFLIKGDESLFNESCKYVIKDKLPPREDFFNSVKKKNPSFKKIHKHFTNTSVKIATRFKDLLCFIVCIYMKNTLYLDIDTTFKQFNPEKIPTSSSPKLFLPIIFDSVDSQSNHVLYKTDLYAVLSLDSVVIDVLVVNNYVQIIEDYLDAVPYYYLGFTTIGPILEIDNYNIGVSYLRDQFNITSTVLLTFAHFIFQQQNDGISLAEPNEVEFSNKLRLINDNMMMFPNIYNLEPEQMLNLRQYYNFKNYLKLEKNIPTYSIDKIPAEIVSILKEFKEFVSILEQFKEFVSILEKYKKKCAKINKNITEKKESIFFELWETKTKKTDIYEIIKNSDSYEIVIFIYEFRKNFNNKFLDYLIQGIEGIEVKESPHTLYEGYRDLENWYCQMLDEGYKDGFNDLFNLSKLYTFDESRVFPYLGKCQVTLEAGQVLCDNGIIDFDKKFNHSYFA